jgi:hypothetical protein
VTGRLRFNDSVSAVPEPLFYNPPDFHVEFQGEKVTFTFEGRLRCGNTSSGTAGKLVRDWARRHRLELMIIGKTLRRGGHSIESDH